MSRWRWQGSTNDDGVVEKEAHALSPGKRPLTIPSRAPVARTPGKRTITQSIARSSAREAPAKVPHAVSDVLSSEQGRPLDDADAWSVKMAADVSDARVVTNARAARAAEAIDAEAFTVGNRIFFGESTYDPGSSRGESLLRHELTHVVQQQGATTPAIDQIGFTTPGDAAESEADRAETGSALATAGHSVAIASKKNKTSATKYIKAHERKLKTAVMFRLNVSAAYVRDAVVSTYISWLGPSTELAVRLHDGLDSGDIVTTIRRLCAPDVLEHIVDQGRAEERVVDWLYDYDHPVEPQGAVGTEQWSDNVGVEIGNSLMKRLRESLTRMVPRYVRAKNVAQQREWAKTQTCDPSIEPEPDPSQIITSHPMDSVVIAALCGGGLVKVHLDAYRADNPDQAEETELPALRQVTVKTLFGDGRWGWFRTTESDATPEEVANVIFGAPDQAYRLTGSAPLFGMSPESVTALVDPYLTEFLVLARKHLSVELFEEEREFRAGGWGGATLAPLEEGDALWLPEMQGWRVPALQDPADEALRPSYVDVGSPLGDEIALSQSGKDPSKAEAKKAPRDRDQILAQMGHNKLVLQSIKTLIGTFKLTSPYFKDIDVNPDMVAGEMQRVDERRAQLTAADDSEVAKWDDHTDEQSEILLGVSNGLTAAYQQMVQLSQSLGSHLAPDIEKMAKAASKPLKEVARAYLDAVLSSHFPGTARQKLALADQKSQLYPVMMMEEVLRGVQAALRNASGKNKRDSSQHNDDKYGVSKLEFEERQLRRDLARLRELILNGSPEAGELIQTIWAKVDDLQTEASIVANLDALDGAWSTLKQLQDSWWTGMLTDRELANLRAESSLWYVRWTAIYAEWKLAEKVADPDQRATKKLAAKASFEELRKDPKLQDFFQRASDTIEDVQTIMLIKQLVVILAIAVISWGAGAAVGGFVGSAGLGWSAAATAGAMVVTEATVFTALHTAAFVENPTLAGVAAEFGFNVVLFGALRGMSHLMRQSKLLASIATTDAGLVKGIELGGQGLVLGAATLARAEVEKRLKLGKGLTKEEVVKISAESTAMFIAMVVLGRVSQPLMLKLENAGAQLGGLVKSVNAQRRLLADSARALKVTKDPAEAKKLLTEERAELQKEIELYEALNRTVREKPEVLEQAGMTAKEIEALKLELPGEIVSVKRGEIMLELESIGGDNFRLPRQKIPEHLAKHHANEAKVEILGQDKVTGARAYEVAYKDGKRIRIFESTENARPGAGEPPPTPEIAAANRAAADAAARIQAERDAQLTRLIDDAGGPLVFERIILGSGQAGTLAFATAKGGAGTGAAPGVEITKIPSVINVAPEGSMFAAHGEFKIGQSAGELRSSGNTRQPGEFTADHTGRISANDFVRSLIMTGHETGMVTYKATITEVQVNPRDGSWPANTNLRVKANGKWLYTNNYDGAGGLGPPNALGRPGSKLEAGQESQLLSDGLMVHAQESLSLPAKVAKNGEIAVVGDGATGAWAVEAAVKGGARKVYWYGGGPKKAPAPPEVRAELKKLGLTDVQIDTYYRAYNERNAEVFKLIKSGKVVLESGMKDASKITSGRNKGRVAIEAAGKERVVDGIVSAIGSRLALPKGIESMQFRMVTVNYGGKERVVALEALGANGKPNGVRLVGAQITHPGIVGKVMPSEQSRFQELLEQQTSDPSVPRDSQGVPGSIYQTGINVPLANQGQAPRVPNAAAPFYRPDDEIDEQGGY